MASEAREPLAAGAPLADAGDRLRAATTFDRNVVVTAGAGTGKTTLLTERLLNLFFRREDPAHPAQCVALTFTNRAAGEMAERLRACLEKFLAWAGRGGPPPGSDGVPARMYWDLAGRYGWTHGEMGALARRTLRDLELAPISTYHGFAARLLRLYPLQAGVDPYFREDDGTVFEESLARRWEEWLAGELAEGAPREALWRRALRRFDLPALQDLAKRMCSELIPLEDLMEDLERAPAEGTIFEAPPGWLEGEVAAARELARGFEKNRKIEDWTRKAVEVLEAFHRREPEEAIRKLAARIQSGMPNNVKGIPEKVYAACKRVITLARGLASLDRGALRDALEAVFPFARAFREEFVRSGYLHFDALLVRARDLLRDRPEIRRRLKERFRHLLVDEFQDTDPIQYEIVLYLAEARGTEAREWRDVRLEGGKLFVVGDPKQSIYSFRGADIEAYHVLLRDVLQEKPLQLRVNFRSHDRVVSAVNGIFGRLIRGEERIQPDYVPAEPRPGGPASLESQKVEVRVVRPEGDGTWNSGEAAEGEAREIARWIREDLVGQAEVPDRERGKKFAEFGDVALLFRKMTGVGAYVDALRAQGVPHVVEAGRGFFETQEVTDFLNLLAALAYPEDRLAWAGVLRSPIGGLNDKELYAWAQGLPLPKAPSLGERLERVRAEIRRLPVSEALDRVLSAFPVLESAALLAGEQGRNNVLKVRSLALGREQSLGVGFAGLVDWLRSQGREIRDEGESPLAEEDLNAVKLLTVHKAKGLEFPVVVLAGLHAGSRRPGEAVRLRRDWSTGTWDLRAGSIRTPGAVWAEDRADALADAEERRLLYVAATRARERLLFSAAVRHENGRMAGAEGFLGYLNEALGADAREEGARWPPMGGEMGGARIERVFVTSPPQGAAPEGSGPGAAVPEDLEAAWRARKERAERIRGERLDARPSDLGDEEGGAGEADAAEAPPREWPRQVGSAVHDVMERIDLKAPAKGLEEVVRVSVEGLFPDLPGEEERIRREVRGIVEGFIQSADFKEKIQPFRVLGREVPCLLPMKGEDEYAGSAEGYADLVIEDAEGVLVVDYKTDRVERSEAYGRVERYRRQGELYARAVSEALGLPVRRFGVAFLRPGVLQVLPLEEG
ncbi:MAG: UvrD-helicase domain-containing protein [Candidatus Tectomicrobia bacterium]|nr:UvrD-helicase domain-containing protein [Candidatus Tectomicrobia bacterium]